MATTKSGALRTASRHPRKLNPQTLAIVRAIMGLAAGLNMKVVAEGIETKEDLACLAAEGCKEGQGYYFGCAQPQAEVLKLLSADKARHMA